MRPEGPKCNTGLSMYGGTYTLYSNLIYVLSEITCRSDLSKVVPNYQHLMLLMDRMSS